MPLRAFVLACSLTSIVACGGTLHAQERGPQLGEEQIQNVRVGMIVSARTGPCTGIVATTPVPVDWPEQAVQVVDEQVPSSAKISYRTVAGSIKQMLVEIPMLPAGEEAEVAVTFEVTRRAVLAPEDTSVYIIPKRLDKHTRLCLGPSPFIESRHQKIKAQAKALIADKPTAWEQVDALYQFVRENIKLSDGPKKGAFKAMKEGTGNIEDLASLFIALCRSSAIPARTVWLPGECYAEFYLEDDAGKGHWFPCDIAGQGALGTTTNFKPIYQKGDNFKVPERPRDAQRYVSEFLTGAGGQPKVKFIREVLAAGAR